VAHFNHQLRAESAQADADFVQTLAEQWQLPFYGESYPVRQFAAAHKQSFEQAARQLRYAFLGRVAATMGANKVAVGHSADDQAETVLMHLLRGSGLSGLAGMRPRFRLADLALDPPALPHLNLIRPLLSRSRVEIEAYCQAQALLAREDRSNQDPAFFRNRLRHDLLPYLERYNPKIRHRLSQTAQILAADVEFLTEQARQLWPQLVREETAQHLELDLSGWAGRPLALKRALVRLAYQKLQPPALDLTFSQVQRVVEIADRAETGLTAVLPHQVRATISYDRLHLFRADQPASLGEDQPRLTRPTPLPVQIPGLTPLPDTAWQLRAELWPQSGPEPARFEPSHRWEAFMAADIVGRQVTLRPRRPGDVFHPFGLGGHRRKINRFMIDQKIPVERRESIPLLASGDQIWWLCGYRCDERSRVQATTPQILHLIFEKIKDS
jgi:tRNA(Ile)-lysidine synthase